MGVRWQQLLQPLSGSLSQPLSGPLVSSFFPPAAPPRPPAAAATTTARHHRRRRDTTDTARAGRAVATIFIFHFARALCLVPALVRRERRGARQLLAKKARVVH